VACLSVIYKIHDYAEYNFVTSNLFLLFCLFIFSSITPILYIFAYIFFKAASLETNDPKYRETLQKVASDYYLSAFKVTFILIIGMFTLYICKAIADALSTDVATSKSLFILESIFVIILAPVLYVSIAQSEVLKPLNIMQFRDVESFLATGFILSLLIIPFILSGHFMVGIDSIYYRQNQQIPIDISVTGARTSNIQFDLFRVGSQEPIDSIYMGPSNSSNANFNNSNNMSSNNSSNRSSSNSSTNGVLLDTGKNAFMYDKYLGLGRYKMFINCSNLTDGYYEISAYSPLYQDFKHVKPSPTLSYLNNSTHIYFLHLDQSVTDIFCLTETNKA
jgi:hypothetical protein